MVRTVGVAVAMFGANECKRSGPFCAVALHTDVALQRKAALLPEASCSLVSMSSASKQRSFGTGVVHLRTTCVSNPNYFTSCTGVAFG